MAKGIFRGRHQDARKGERIVKYVIKEDDKTKWEEGTIELDVSKHNDGGIGIVAYTRIEDHDLAAGTVVFRPNGDIEIDIKGIKHVGLRPKIIIKGPGVQFYM